MPLVHISILKGKSPDYIRAISESIHQSLVEAYNVPAGDRFQLIHQHDREEFVYDADYLGVHRTDDVVFIHVTAGKWRDTATKKALFKRRGGVYPLSSHFRDTGSASSANERKRKGITLASAGETREKN